MVRARERSFDREVWTEFNRLHTELEGYFEDVTDYLVTRAMGSDGDDSAIGRRKGSSRGCAAACRGRLFHRRRQAGRSVPRRFSSHPAAAAGAPSSTAAISNCVCV